MKMVHGIQDAGFNEAGADAPEILHRETPISRFPLASMRPGRMPRKYLNEVLTQGGFLFLASMRPGRMPRKYEPDTRARFHIRLCLLQ